MTDKSISYVIAAAFIFTLGAVVGNCGGSIARASENELPSATHPERTVTPALALARLCVNEAGIRAYTTDDCAAIHAVIRFRAEYIYHTDYLTALHRYSNDATVDRTGRSRPWIAQLWPDMREPASWTPAARWAGRHDRWWLRSYRHALDVYRGDVRPRCAPHTWARSDVQPADPAAERIDCGETRNVFWMVPRYRARWGA